jgi:cytochrome c
MVLIEDDSPWKRFGGALNNIASKVALLAAGALLMAATSGPALAFDEEAAKALARQNNCFKCHGATKAKDGPAYHDVAAKYKEKYKDVAQAEQRLYTHLTTGEKAKFPDGHEEEHKILKAKEAEITNLIQWILSL